MSSNGVNGHSNGHVVETASHLFDNGVQAAKEVQEGPKMQDLDVSKLSVTITKSPGKVPEPDSVEMYDMKTCTDHSMGFLFRNVGLEFLLTG
jgi:branched-chain amino acid aminotransferase